ncbi:Protein-S-isoprenylcysteine O-methyltransferase [Anthophora quadrimaculata]
MLCYDGKLSFFCFIAAALIAVLPEVLLRLEFDVPRAYFDNIWLTNFFQYGFLNIFLLLAFRGFSYQVAIRAAFLGYAFGIGIVVFFVASPSWKTFAYGVAACSSWIEFIVERQYFPAMKEPSPISYFGLMLCISGELLRKLAMFTAKHNFNHVVQSEKRDNHELVTHGVYKLCRHPSYVGWFYWSIGTQLILQNPFCLLAYTVASWKFFYDRVLIEEITLLNFFGQDYVEYQKEVDTGLPFISGYKLHL